MQVARPCSASGIAGGPFGHMACRRCQWSHVCPAASADAYARRVRSLKAGKVVILLTGRYAGKKAVVIKTQDEGTPDRSYGFCIVAGIDKYPLKITKKMSAKKVTKRSRIKPFIKVVNYNHIMPTRYSLEVDLKHVVNQEVVARPDARPNARKEVKKALEEKYQSSLKTGKNRWFFNKLRF